MEAILAGWTITTPEGVLYADADVGEAERLRLLAANIRYARLRGYWVKPETEEDKARMIAAQEAEKAKERENKRLFAETMIRTAKKAE